MTKIIVNGVEVEADPKQPLVHACHEHGVDVPTYCYHPGLSPVGSCRMCQVEVTQGEMPPRVVVACRTPVAEGMVVNTESAGAHAARKECLEFLLKNHPLDCPICDKAGECDLQDFSFKEGQSEGRSVEPRRKLEKRKSLGDTILLDEERCILCSRCVRFFEEVTGKALLTVSGLASRSVISTFGDRPLEGNYQGNVADICPVGALTLNKFRFQARVWNLSKSFSTCGECSRGCSITVEVLRGKDVKRLRPRYNSEVNRWWMCDHGRFSFDGFNTDDRLAGTFVRGSSGLEETPRGATMTRAAELLSSHGTPLLLASPWLTVEEGAALKRIAGALSAAPRFLSPAPSPLADDLLHTGDPAPNRRGLEELGFEAIEKEAALEALGSTKSALLVGERIGELVGPEDLAALEASVRIVLCDTNERSAPAITVAIGAPNAVERTGTWVNVDGHRGPIAAARSAPSGVAPLTRTLEELSAQLTESKEVARP